MTCRGTGSDASRPSGPKQCLNSHEGTDLRSGPPERQKTAERQKDTAWKLSLAESGLPCSLTALFEAPSPGKLAVNPSTAWGLSSGAGFRVSESAADRPHGGGVKGWCPHRAEGRRALRGTSSGGSPSEAGDGEPAVDVAWGRTVTLGKTPLMESAGRATRARLRGGYGGQRPPSMPARPPQRARGAPMLASGPPPLGAKAQGD